MTEGARVADRWAVPIYRGKLVSRQGPGVDPAVHGEPGGQDTTRNQYARWGGSGNRWAWPLAVAGRVTGAPRARVWFG